MISRNQWQWGWQYKTMIEESSIDRETPKLIEEPSIDRDIRQCHPGTGPRHKVWSLYISKHWITKSDQPMTSLPLMSLWALWYFVNKLPTIIENEKTPNGTSSHIGLSRTHIVHNLGMIGSMQRTSHAIATWRYFCPFLCLISNTSLGVTSLLCISHPHVSVDTLTATDRDCILFRSCWSIISLSMMVINCLCLQLLSSHR